MNFLPKIKKYGMVGFFIKAFFWIYKSIYFNLSKIYPSKYSLSLYGVFIKKNFSDNTFKYYLIAQYGRFFSKFIKKQTNASIFIDIGSNQGLYSLIALKNKNFNKIFSFEPQRNIYKILCQNIKRNLGDKRCMPFNLGISNLNSKAFLQSDNRHSGKAKIIAENLQNSEIIETVSGKNLSKILNINNNEKVGIKIDTEGHELKVLKGLIDTNFWKNTIWVFIEFNKNVDHDEIFQLLTIEGFITIKKISTNNPNHYDLLMGRDEALMDN